MVTRNVVLTETQSELVDRLVAAGRYQNASEALRAGLRLVEREEAEFGPVWRSGWIRRGTAIWPLAAARMPSAAPSQPGAPEADKGRRCRNPDAGCGSRTRRYRSVDDRDLWAPSGRRL